MKRLAVVCATVALLVMPTVAAASQPSELGADPETTYIDSDSARSVEAEDLSTEYGISLDEALNWIDDRESVESLVEEIQGNRGDEFAGVYFTKTDGYVLHIIRASTSPGAPIDIPATKSLRIVFEVAPKSQNELNALVQEVANNFEISLVRADESTGKVLVQARTQEAADAISSKYGDDVSVTTVADVDGLACNSMLDCTPWRGGIGIGVSDYICTSGFVAKGNTNGAWRLITAGHCGNHTWIHANVTIGTTARNCLLDATPCPWGAISNWGDYQKIPYPIPDPFGPPRYCVMGPHPYNCYVMNLGTKDKSGIADGDDVQVRGLTTGWHGSVNIDDHAVAYTLSQDPAHHVVSGFWSANPGTAPGDSGGPAIWNARIWGLVSGHTPGTTDATFAYASDAVHGLNVTTRTTSAC